MKKMLIGLCIGLVLGLSVGFGIYANSRPKAAVATHVSAVAPDTQGLWAATNVQRQKNGETPLLLDINLDTSASNKCQDMAAKKYWSHNAPDGTTWQSFIEATAGLTHYMGENLYYGYSADSAAVVAQWMKSPEHRANILNANFTHVGYDVCVANNYQGDSKAYIVVQHLT